MSFDFKPTNKKYFHKEDEKGNHYHLHYTNYSFQDPLLEERKDEKLTPIHGIVFFVISVFLFILFTIFTIGAVRDFLFYFISLIFLVITIITAYFSFVGYTDKEIEIKLKDQE